MLPEEPMPKWGWGETAGLILQMKIKTVIKQFIFLLLLQ